MEDKMLKHLKENWNKMQQNENLAAIAALSSSHGSLNNSFLGKIINKLFPSKEQKERNKILQLIIGNIKKYPEFKQALKDLKSTLSKYPTRHNYWDSGKDPEIRNDLTVKMKSISSEFGKLSTYDIAHILVDLYFYSPKEFDKLIS